jgi:hypothetical protein
MQNGNWECQRSHWQIPELSWAYEYENKWDECEHSEELIIDGVGDGVDEESGANSGLGVDIEFDFHEVFFEGGDEVDDDLNDAIFLVFLECVAGY